MRLHEWFAEDKYVYLIHEYCCGEPLYRRLGASKGFSEYSAAQVAQQLFALINYLSTLGIYCRNLSPLHVYFDSVDPAVLTVKIYNPQLEQIIRDSLVEPSADDEMVSVQKGLLDLAVLQSTRGVRAESCAAGRSLVSGRHNLPDDDRRTPLYGDRRDRAATKH